MITNRVSNLGDLNGNSPLDRDEANMNEAYRRNMAMDNLSMLDLREVQMTSSLLQVKATLETNAIKVKADICKNIARNVVP
jgi:hypothetical protein